MNSEVTKRNTAQTLPSGELTVWGLKRQKGKQIPGSNECYNREPPRDRSGTHRKDVTLPEDQRRLLGQRAVEPGLEE